MKSKNDIFSIANISLIFMTVLQIIMPIMVRFAHKRAASFGKKFHSTSAVSITEATKILMCVMVLIGIHRMKFKDALYKGFVVNKYETLKMAVPAVIYFMQTNLYYTALNKLNAAVFTITYQLRILSIAILATLILKKIFTIVQWGALLICLAGAIFVNSSKFNGNTTFDPEQVDQLIGIGLVLTMCWMSAFAGVYLEKVLKNSRDDLWLQNLRLSLVSLTISLCYISHRFITIEDYDFFEGWNYWNWIVSLATAIGGLITAAVLKYADNIRKSFCQSLAICGTTFLSIVMGDSNFYIGLLVGTILVVVSIFVYTFGSKKPAKKEEDVEKRNEEDGEKSKADLAKVSVTLEKVDDNEEEPMLNAEKVEKPYKKEHI